MKVELKKALELKAKYKTLKEYIIITYIAFAFLGFLASIMFTELNAKILSIFEYLGLVSILNFFSLITIVFLLIYIIICCLRKTDNVEIINNYLILSFYLIALSLSSAVIIMYSLIPNEIILDETIDFFNANTDENAKGANIKCTTKSFVFVKGETILCFITGEIPKSILTNQTDVEFTEISITQSFYDINDDSKLLEYKSVDYSQSLYNDRFITVKLLEKDYVFLTFLIHTTDSAIAGFASSNIVLVNRDLANSNIQQSNNLIYTLLLFSMSFSILAVFGGINSLRQIIQNGNAEQRKQKKDNRI